MPDVFLATAAAHPHGDPDTRLLITHLARIGVSAEAAVWSDPSVPWSAAAVTVVRSTWDYHERRPEFLAWAASVPRIHNDRETLEWNSHKGYLAKLDPHLPVLPTLSIEDPTPSVVHQAMRREGWGSAVLKPAVGLDGHGVTRLDEHHRLPSALQGVWLLQPFADEVVTAGELSVVVIDGRATHAVRRVPAVDDYRTQERLGGRVEPAALTPETATLAERFVHWLDGAPRLYARVDLVTYGGRPHLMELELVEPSLFLAHGPAGLEALGNAVRARVR